MTDNIKGAEMEFQLRADNTNTGVGWMEGGSTLGGKTTNLPPDMVGLESMKILEAPQKWESRVYGGG